MIDELLTAARSALAQAPPIGDPAYARFAGALGHAVERRWPDIVAANDRDVAGGRERGHPEPLLHRLRLTSEDRERMTALTEDVRRSLAEATGLGPEYRGARGTSARRVPKPLGVVLMIYEAR